MEREKLNVDMYALNGRVNDLVFWNSPAGRADRLRMPCCKMSWRRNYPSDYSLCGQWNSQSGRSGCCESGAIEYPPEESGTDYLPGRLI